MEKQTVFIKRYPNKGDFPKEDNIWYDTNIGYVKFDTSDKKWLAIGGIVTWWLEEIELPSEEDVENYGRDEYWYTNMEETLEPFKKGANFILNHLK